MRKRLYKFPPPKLLRSRRRTIGTGVLEAPPTPAVTIVIPFLSIIGVLRIVQLPETYVLVLRDSQLPSL